MSECECLCVCVCLRNFACKRVEQWRTDVWHGLYSSPNQTWARNYGAAQFEKFYFFCDTFNLVISHGKLLKMRLCFHVSSLGSISLKQSWSFIFRLSSTNKTIDLTPLSPWSSFRSGMQAWINMRVPYRLNACTSMPQIATPSNIIRELRSLLIIATRIYTTGAYVDI